MHDEIDQLYKIEEEQMMKGANRDVKQSSIEIISDGTREGTYIRDIFSGKRIQADIDSINWYVYGGQSRAIVIFANVPIRAKAGAYLRRK